MVENPQSKIRLALALSILLITPVGFLTKAYHGPLDHWVNDSLGGLLYVTFWSLVAAFMNPRWPEKQIAIIVFLVTSALEILQLWHPPFLEFIRSFYLGRVLIGTTFVWSDFFYYFLGAWLGWWWIKKIKAKIVFSS